MSTHYSDRDSAVIASKANRAALTRTRRSPDERREQILAAAVELFARQGFARTTTKEIAARAGISEGTIYKYFGSKQDLLFAFIEAFAVQPLQSLLAAREEGSEAEVVEGFFLNRLSLAERNRPLMKVVLGEALFDPDLAREFSKKIAAPIVRLLEAYISDRVREGRFRDVNPRVGAGALAGLFMSFAVLWPTLLPKGRPLPPTPELAKTLAALFLEGVALPSTARHHRTTKETGP